MVKMDVDVSSNAIIDCDVLTNNDSDFVQCESKDNKDKLRVMMLTRIANSDAHFKHQQRGDPDLTFEDKYSIANEVLSKSPSLFLSRFGQYISLDDIPYFDDMKDEYEVHFYLADILRQNDKVHNHKIVNNRRYAAMQELVSGDEYFSELEMKWRDPALYEEMIGQHMSEDEIQYRVKNTDYRLSTLLFRQMDQIEENRLYFQQKEIEESQYEEDDDSEDENEQEMPKAKNTIEDDKHEEEDDEKQKPEMSEEERDMLREEFLHIMQERFMSGKDKDFDYSKVDTNPRYDSLDTLNIDEEEKYFDEEDPQVVESPMMLDSPKIGPTPNRNSPATVSNLSGSMKGDDEVEDYMIYEPSLEIIEAASELKRMTMTCGSDIKNAQNDNDL